MSVMYKVKLCHPHMVLIGAAYPGTCIVSNQGRDFTNTDVFTSKMLMIGQIFVLHL